MIAIRRIAHSDDVPSRTRLIRYPSSAWADHPFDVARSMLIASSLGQIGTSVRWRSPRRNSDPRDYAARCSHIRCSDSRIDFGRNRIPRSSTPAGQFGARRPRTGRPTDRYGASPGAHCRGVTARGQSPSRILGLTGWYRASFERQCGRSVRCAFSYPGARGDHQWTGERRCCPYERHFDIVQRIGLRIAGMRG